MDVFTAVPQPSCRHPFARQRIDSRDAFPTCAGGIATSTSLCARPRPSMASDVPPAHVGKALCCPLGSQNIDNGNQGKNLSLGQGVVQVPPRPHRHGVAGRGTALPGDCAGRLAGALGTGLEQHRRPHVGAAGPGTLARHQHHRPGHLRAGHLQHPHRLRRGHGGGHPLHPARWPARRTLGLLRQLLGGRTDPVADGRARCHPLLPLRGRPRLCPAGQPLRHAHRHDRHLLDHHLAPGARRGDQAEELRVRRGGARHRPAPAAHHLPPHHPQYLPHPAGAGHHRLRQRHQVRGHPQLPGAGHHPRRLLGPDDRRIHPGGAGRPLLQLRHRLHLPLRAGDGLQHVLGLPAGRAGPEEGERMMPGRLAIRRGDAPPTVGAASPPRTCRRVTP